jgi:hypothetical protein
MSNTQFNIDSLRAEIDKAASSELRLLARYVEALHEKQSDEIADIKRAFQTAKGGLAAIKWLAALGGSLAVIITALKGGLK